MSNPEGHGSWIRHAEPRAGSEAWVAERVARLPKFPILHDLLEVFGSRDQVLDAYSRGWLPPLAEEALEGNSTRLLCWLTARQLRVALEAREPKGVSGR